MMEARFNVLSRLMIGFEGLEIPSYLPDLAARGLRSVVIYGSNLKQGHDLFDWVQAVRLLLGEDAIVAIDEEGGDVTRVDYLSGSRFAGNAALGNLDDTALTESDGISLGKLLAELGINLNFAPVADVNVDPNNPVIGNRSFGSDQDLVSRHVASFVRGHESTGVGTTLKHFPGHGNVSVDSHVALPKIAGGWTEVVDQHLKPFEAGIEAGAAAVMVGHLDLGDKVPSSLSAIVIDKLRRELKFAGLIITDALDMGAITNERSLAQAAVDALLAGNDLACLGPNTKPEDIEEILRLWSELPQEVRSQNQLLATERMARFLDDRQLSNSGPGQPSCQLDLQIPSDFVRARVLRVVSGSNPAVGEVPWFPGLPAKDVTLETLSSEVDDDLAILLTRGPHQPEQVVKRLTELQQARVLVVSADPVPESYPLLSLVTYGSAQPQSEALMAQITRKENDVVGK